MNRVLSRRRAPLLLALLLAVPSCEKKQPAQQDSSDWRKSYESTDDHPQKKPNFGKHKKKKGETDEDAGDR